MQYSLRWLLTAVTVLITTGCSKAPAPEQPNTLHLVIGAAQTRNPRERDTALAEACRESSAQYSLPAVTMGLPQIMDGTLRDAIAIECANVFFDSGKIEDAIAIAKLIKDTAKREELIATFEEGT